MRFCNRITFRPRVPGSSPAAIPFPSALGGLPAGKASPRLRDRWPFLNDPSTPVELKALITERITPWYEYSKLYQQLRDCQTPEECADVSRRLLDAYFDNRQITAEMDYYQQHRKVLGRHPMFRHYQQLARLRSCSVKDLLREQKKTKDNIWRVNSEIRKGDKPHLLENRRQKLQEYELRLQEINRLLGD